MKRHGNSDHIHCDLWAEPLSIDFKLLSKRGGKDSAVGGVGEGVGVGKGLTARTAAHPNKAESRGDKAARARRRPALCPVFWGYLVGF